MEYLILIIAIIFINTLITFRSDITKRRKSVLSDRFFLALIIFPLILAFVLSIPIWMRTQFDFTHDGYARFVSYFQLPLILIGLTSTIAAVYGFIHTSNQREREITHLILSKRLEAAEKETKRLESIGDAIKMLTLVMVRISDHLGSLKHSVLEELPNNKDTIKYDIDTITTYWSSIYLETKYMPAISKIYEEMRTINADLRIALVDAFQTQTQRNSGDTSNANLIFKNGQVFELTQKTIKTATDKLQSFYDSTYVEYKQSLGEENKLKIQLEEENHS